MTSSTNASKTNEPTTRTPEDAELARRLAAAYRVLLNAARRAKEDASSPSPAGEPSASDAASGQIDPAAESASEARQGAAGGCPYVE